MNQLDVLLLVLLLPFTFRGYSRGFCREAFGLAGWMAVVLAAGAVGPAAAKVLLDERLAPPVAAQPLGWAVVFVGTWVVAALLGRIAERLASALLLGGFNRFAGMLFGSAKGAALIGFTLLLIEQTPSCTVREARSFFHFLGGAGHGAVFAFVIKPESLPSPGGGGRVAARLGVPLREGAGEPARPGEPLTAANAAAAAFFQAELRGPGGGRARAYLRERGLSEEVIERFGLGWAPGSGEALARHLRTKGVPLEDALTAGLVMRRDRPDGAGGVLDRFRERIMFPITDTSGKVIAFGGRILPGRPAGGEPPPKYLNSAESPVFRKGHTLYGLALARDAIRKADRAIVVEGYLDLIALAQAGIGEVVAPLGTAPTAEQLRLLRRFAETVIACFDGDLAGRRAAARSFPVFLEAGLWGRGAFLPAGEDPDTFVRAQGRVALEGVLAAAEPLVEPFLGELAGPNRDAVGRHPK